MCVNRKTRGQKEKENDRGVGRTHTRICTHTPSRMVHYGPKMRYQMMGCGRGNNNPLHRSSYTRWILLELLVWGNKAPWSTPYAMEKKEKERKNGKNKHLEAVSEFLRSFKSSLQVEILLSARCLHFTEPGEAALFRFDNRAFLTLSIAGLKGLRKLRSLHLSQNNGATQPPSKKLWQAKAARVEKLEAKLIFAELNQQSRRTSPLLINF